MEEITISDNGEVDVQIAPVGDFNGSDADGNPVPETLTQEGLDELASKLNERGEDVLVDTDHSSCRAGLDRNTQAAGWISKFWTNVKGLFGKMKLTKSGRELVENREYRFLSPTFSLDQNGRPVELHSVALTNTPAFQGSINPIINHAAKSDDADFTAATTAPENITNTNDEKEDKILMEMTIEQLKELIKGVIADLKKEEAVKKVEEEIQTENETHEDIVENLEEKKEEVENACSEKTEEVKNEEVSQIETKEEKKEEVISLEALNSAPTPDTNAAPAWKNLHGHRFWNYLRDHPELTH